MDTEEFFRIFMPRMAGVVWDLVPMGIDPKLAAGFA